MRPFGSLDPSGDIVLRGLRPLRPRNSICTFGTHPKAWLKKCVSDRVRETILPCLDSLKVIISYRWFAFSFLEIWKYLKYSLTFIISHGCLPFCTFFFRNIPASYFLMSSNLETEGFGEISDALHQIQQKIKIMKLCFFFPLFSNV